MKLVLMGTPQFAVPMLHALSERHELLGVVTQPDRPKGRKGTPIAPPVKTAAQALGIPVYQFAKIRDEAPSALMEGLGADAFITAAYGQILTRRHLSAAPYGVINAHASLLPKYRGAAPVNRALMAGEKRTGITIMHTDVGVDEGDMILSRAVDILSCETAGELLHRLSFVAADAMIEALDLLERGQAPRVPQDHVNASRQPMLKKEDGFLPLALSACGVCDHARGVTPWPGACVRLGGEVLKLEGLCPADGEGEAGEILCADGALVVACGEGAVRIAKVQAPGRRMMAAADFLRGRPGLLGQRFSP